MSIKRIAFHTIPPLLNNNYIIILQINFASISTVDKILANYK